MPEDTAKPTPRQQVAKPIIKFIIGFIAGLCAAFFPRLTAALAMGNGDTNIVLFDATYITLSLIFAALVGLIVMILEWGVPREPRATFMMAIGVPALITGSLNTTTSVDTVSSQAKENQALVKQLQEIANIPTLPAGGITPLSLNENDDGVTQGQRGLAWLDMVGITEAQAASPGEKKGAMAVGITIDEPLYYIVLQVTASKEAAKQQAQQLQADIPSVIAVQSGTQYLILYSKNPVKRADAVLITLKVKQRFQLQPKLMPAQ